MAYEENSSPGGGVAWRLSRMTATDPAADQRAAEQTSAEQTSADRPVLKEQPRLVPPTATVRDSYLAGERADCVAEGRDTEWLGPAGDDFEAFVAQRVGVRVRWEVPSTLFWYVSGEHYLGSLVVRHSLTPELAEVGGHVGYHVVGPWRRQGHATRMLAAGLVECRDLGLGRVLLTCGADNTPSRRVIRANGGVADGQVRGDDRFWITVGT